MFDSQDLFQEQNNTCSGYKGYFKIKDSKDEVIYVCNECGEMRKFIPILLNKPKKTMWEKLKEVRKANER